MAASRYLFWINIFVLLVWTAACGNPYLRSRNADDDMLEMDNLASIDDVAAFSKRAADEELQAREERQREHVERLAAERGQQLDRLAGLDDEDIALALSRLSVAELESLDRYMDEESAERKMMDKREAVDEQRDEVDYEAEDGGREPWKRNTNVEYGEDYADGDEIGLTKRCGEEHRHGEHSWEHRHLERHSNGGGNYHNMDKRMIDGRVAVPSAPLGVYRRESSFNLAADKHVQAKINLLREKKKRQMARKSDRSILPFSHISKPHSLSLSRTNREDRSQPHQCGKTRLQRSIRAHGCESLLQQSDRSASENQAIEH